MVLSEAAPWPQVGSPEDQGLVTVHLGTRTLWMGLLAEARYRARGQSEVDKEPECDQEAETGSQNLGLTPDELGEVPFCAQSGTLSRRLPPVTMSGMMRQSQAGYQVCLSSPPTHV